MATSDTIFANIERFQGSSIIGWLYSPVHRVTPVLFVDNVQATLVRYPYARADVKKALAINDDAGYEFQSDGIKAGQTCRLYALIDDKLVLIKEKTAPESSLAKPDASFLKQLDRAAKISQQKGAVAVTSWDGAHNPIGRAKVLYDVLDGRRPVVLFTYFMGPFGTNLWAPLRDSDIALVTIPWAERDAYHAAILAAGIQFETVWICKSRLPNFHLAAAVAKPDAKLILDFDDNEAHFSMSKASLSKSYGLAGLSLAKMFESRIASRTAASHTLQADFGGTIVRHARSLSPADELDSARPTPPDPAQAAEKEIPVAEPDAETAEDATTKPTEASEDAQIRESIKVGFVGTVRVHKHILKAAKAIAVANWKFSRNIKFLVHGDIQPAALVAELEAAGAETGGMVPSRELSPLLSSFDVVLTGFPASDAESIEINKYQISSKIGDALAHGKPVLVPMSPSVADLDGTPGVFLFDENNFFTQLRAAIDFKDEVSLPPAFTFDGAYAAFAEAEEAADDTPRAASVFSELARSDKSVAELKPSLVLLWKQHDSGMYGRRVDQLARSYKRAHPDHNVHVVEIMHKDDLKNYTERAGNFLSETTMVLELSNAKASTAGLVDADGVLRHQISIDVSPQSNLRLQEHLMRHALLPSNTVFVVFPHIRFYPWMRELLALYPKITDVVDNQVSWTKGNEKKAQEVLLQYVELVRNSETTVFNSENNRDFFLERGLIDETTPVCLIPNWYELPKDDFGAAIPSASTASDVFEVTYSGNMNDRIDWATIQSVAELGPSIRVNLVGGAERAPAAFNELIRLPNVVYHGPQDETYTVKILRRSHLAIMPHVRDHVSHYMNPLKVHMYDAVGLPSVAIAVEGIETNLGSITTVESSREFVQTVVGALETWRTAHHDSRVPPAAESSRPAGAVAYVKLIDQVRKTDHLKNATLNGDFNQ